MFKNIYIIRNTVDLHIGCIFTNKPEFLPTPAIALPFKIHQVKVRKIAIVNTST